MAKRMVTHFSRGGSPNYEGLDDDGQAKPCVDGVPWVNGDTLATIGKRGVTATGPKGERLESDPSSAI